MDWLIQSAYAQAEGGGVEQFMGLLPLVLIFAVFYFLLIRPQNKRQKEHREMVATLSVGDEVVESATNNADAQAFSGHRSRDGLHPVEGTGIAASHPWACRLRRLRRSSVALVGLSLIVLASALEATL